MAYLPSLISAARSNVSVFQFSSYEELEKAVATAIQGMYGVYNVKLDVFNPASPESKDDVSDFDDYIQPLSFTYTWTKPQPKKVAPQPTTVTPIRPPSFWDHIFRRDIRPHDTESQPEEEDEGEEESEVSETWDAVTLGVFNNGVVVVIETMDEDGNPYVDTIGLKLAFEKMLHQKAVEDWQRRHPDKQLLPTA